MSDLEGPHFNTGMAVMAKYGQYLFNLHHNTARTVMQHHIHLTAYDEHSTTISHEHEQLRHENVVLHSGTLPPLEQDHELKVLYRRLSEAEHEWNYNCQQLDLALKEVDTRTHAILHLEHAMEQQDHELEKRAASIATL
jgi:hypothetical protein